MPQAAPRYDAKIDFPGGTRFLCAPIFRWAEEGRVARERAGAPPSRAGSARIRHPPDEQTRAAWYVLHREEKGMIYFHHHRLWLDPHR